MSKYANNDFFSISSNIDIYIKDTSVYFIADDINIIEDCNIELLSAINNLKAGCEFNVIKSILGEIRAEELIDTLLENDFITYNYKNMYIDTIVENQVEYFSTFNKYPNKLQKKLEDSVVCILGIGGIGSIALQHLLACGIKKYILIDGDKVKINNFNRQLIYTKSNIGEYKVHSTREYIKKIDNSIWVECINKYFNSTNDFNILDKYKIDFFICAADKPIKNIRRIVNDYCSNRKIPFTSAGVGIKSGSWGPIIVPGITIDYEKFEENEDKQMTDIEKEILNSNSIKIIKASFSPTNSLIATFMIKDVIEFLLFGKDCNKIGARFNIEFENYKIKKFFL
ncbi:MAG: ThiF family adenylyltransferase [Clostridium sp.]|uniref:ThiF family adenylyltransferase n=1 Tax=Clostridium sp. TaxID=1506 RepID=UPI002A90E84A|nr:ThiF family adenylyltransferase [Clostridium sp.]MDY6228849.1 ThiF family adenylyltransferase [Clostridium sp.]